MNPLHLLVVASLVARLALWVWRWTTGAAATEVPTPPRAAPGDGLLVGWVVVVALASAVVIAIAGPPTFPVLIPAVLLAVEPSPLAEFAVRRGWARAAWWPTRLSMFVWRQDRRGGAAVMAARADLVGGRVPAPPLPDGPLTTGMVFAAGLAAAGAGDRREARALVAASGWFDAQPPPISIVRDEWIAADLASRGQWDRLAALPDARVDTRRLWLLRAAAERLLDLEDAPNAATFEDLCDPVVHDGRWTTLLDRARAARHRAPFVAPPLPEDPQVRALEVHRRALLDPAWLDAALDAWDDAPPPAAIRERVLADLDAAFREADRVPDPGHGAVSAALDDRRHGALLDALGAQARALSERTRAQRDLPSPAEAAAFAWFVLHFPLVDPAPTGAAALQRRAAFRACFAPMVDWSADLYNRRGEYYLFRAVTRWLLAQARLASDEQAAQVLEHNLAASRVFA